MASDYKGIILNINHLREIKNAMLAETKDLSNYEEDKSSQEESN